MTIANSFLFKISKPLQICFVVYDLGKWMDRMWTVFGIEPWEANIRDENSTKDNSVISDMIYMDNPAHFGYKLASALLETGLMIELVQPLSGYSIYSDFLKQHGEGMQHIGWHMVYSYGEYLKVLKMLEENGFPCLQSAKTFASRIGYFDTTKVLGTILDICDFVSVIFFLDIQLPFLYIPLIPKRVLIKHEITIGALNDLVHQGKVRYIGCSNYAGWNLMKGLAISEKNGWENL